MEASRQKIARRAGFSYLAFVVTCIFAGVVRSNLIVYSDAARTMEQIRNSIALFRIGAVDDLVSGCLFLLSAWALYVLLKPVQPNLALLFLLLNAVGVAVQCASLLFLYAPLLMNASAYLQATYSPSQLDALSLLFLNLHRSGFTIAQLFFGTWLFPLGYLVYRSGFLPKWLGILLMADCVGCLIWFFQYFLLPELPVITYPGLAIGFVAEFSLSLYLILRPVKEAPSDIAAA
jgi:hypothetical protein